MPLHIESLTSEVTVMDGDLPLSEKQIEKLVKIVMLRIQQRARDAARQAEATCLDRQATNLERKR
jgi:hypothetical protein